MAPIMKDLSLAHTFWDLPCALKCYSSPSSLLTSQRPGHELQGGQEQAEASLKLVQSPATSHPSGAWCTKAKEDVDWSSWEQSLWTAGGCEDLRETARDPALAAPCALEPLSGGGPPGGRGTGEGPTAARKKFAKCAPRADWLAEIRAILAGHRHSDDGPRPLALECLLH